MDRLASMKMGEMDVAIKSVQYKGSEADAEVGISPKGGDPAAGMSIVYHLQQQGGKWVVTGKQDAHGAVSSPGAAPQGGAMPGAGDPHGGMAVPGGGGTKMPSPDDLPPTGKK